jgi:glycerophosphoryl diester phosphodiesterase
LWTVVPLIYAHRLGRAYGPDSSRTALAHTLMRPVDGLETDCCLTKDGDIVLLHDPLLQLGTTVKGWARERTAAEICAGRLCDRAGRPSQERPLRLAELLDLVPQDTALQLEIKAHADPALARATTREVCRQLAKQPCRERTEVISFYSDASALAAELGFRSRAIVIADYRIEELARWARRAGVGGVCVSTGTINHAELLPLLLPLGLDAVTTDVPHQLLRAMRAPALAGAAPRA